MSSSSVVRTWLISVCLGLCACASESHSTETGNPPFIDATRVTLVMQDDGVHIKGSKGAVMSPAVDVFARNLATDDIARTKVEFDGSFDLAVDGTLDDVYELRVGPEGNSSKPVFVTRDRTSYTYDGGAPAGDAGMLTCREREQAAADQITAVAEHADVTCSDDADCVRVSTGSVCHDHCGEAIVSKTGQAEIEAAQDAVADGVCKTFESDGCVLLVPPCEPEQVTPTCVMGKCERGPMAQEVPASCDGRAALAQAEVEQAAADADRQCTTANDCTLASSVYSCSEACAPFPVSLAGQAQVSRATAATLQRVCGDYFTDGCVRSDSDCALGRAACHDGQCELSDNSCEDRSGQARIVLNAAVEARDLTCEVDADCIATSTSTNCFGGCGTVVSKAGETGISMAIRSIDDTWCDAFEPGCGRPMPQCAEPPGPIACVDGTCGYAE
jgi:hypothetical protein